FFLDEECEPGGARWVRACTAAPVRARPYPPGSTRARPAPPAPAWRHLAPAGDRCPLPFVTSHVTSSRHPFAHAGLSPPHHPRPLPPLRPARVPAGACRPARDAGPAGGRGEGAAGALRVHTGRPGAAAGAAAG